MLDKGTSIKAGTDLEMPFPVWRGPRLIAAVRAGELDEESDINPRVMKMLELRNKTRRAQRDEPETSVIDPETNKVLRRLAADGIVLLRNDNARLSSSAFRANATYYPAIPKISTHWSTTPN